MDNNLNPVIVGLFGFSISLTNVHKVLQIFVLLATLVYVTAKAIIYVRKVLNKQE